MAAKKDVPTGTNKTTYPASYGSNDLFSADEILDQDHMNFIAKNIDKLISILTWRES